jgi:hypothetical protein
VSSPPSGKRRDGPFVANDGEVELGEVKWYGRWRCYAYFPVNDTLYEKTCLRDIANFCEKKTRDQLASSEEGKESK